MHATIPKGNMGYDQYTVPDTSCLTYFCCFPLAHVNIRPWPLVRVSFFQISFKNSELKTIHNAFRDYCVHFFPTTFLEISYKYGLIASEIAGKKPALPASSPINEK